MAPHPTRVSEDPARDNRVNPERYERMVDLFRLALGKSREDRQLFLAQQCRDDHELRMNIEAMLVADEEETSFLSKPPGDIALEALQGDRPPSLVGQTLGYYRVVARLGSGGMGEVFLAEDTRLRRKAALKLLPREFAYDAARLARFEREACAVSALNHPNIVTVYGLERAENVVFLATEFVDGMTLRQLIAERSQSVDKATDLGLQIALALQAAHAYGLVHRDIKPENIMIRVDGLVKVLDFGVAKWTGTETESTNKESPTNGPADTNPGVIVGTPRYMSPEQALGLPVDCRTDLFSLGAVLYETLAGEPAMQGDTASDAIASTLTRDPQPLAVLRPDCPDGLIAVINKALEKSRERRYVSATEIIEDLRSVAAMSKAEPVSRQIAGRSAWRTLIIAAATSLLLIVATFFLRRVPNSIVDSVAVLPIVNEGDPNMQFVADGLTDSFIGDFSEIPNLKVSPRATVFQFEQQQLDPARAGSLLAARKVLLGGLAQESGRLRIHLSLIETSTKQQIWSGNYAVTMDDLLEVEGRISSEVARKLAIPLAGTTSEELQKRHDVRPEAYRLYLRGDSALHGPTQADVESAVLYLHRALESDSSYAPAAVDLANAYITLADYISPREAMPKAREYALKAVDAGGAPSAAHATLGLIKLLYDWDWGGAAKELAQDPFLNPQGIETFACYLHYKDAVHRTNETERKIATLLARDPLSAWLNHEMGCSSYYARHYDRAIEQFSRTVKINPDFQIAYANAGRAFVQQKKYKEAISTLEAGRKIDPSWPLLLSELAYAQAAAGHRMIASGILSELGQLEKRRYVDAVPIALVYLRMGDQERAFSYLEKAYAERSSSIPWLRAEPRLDSVRSDPRYLDLLRRTGLNE
jgi:eukaryotic-like serine/threonine-protein kinase